MLKDKSSSAIVAVSAIDRARAFYQDTLGLEIVDDSMGDVLVFRTGATSLIVYKSDFSGTNKANAVVWDVGDEIEPITAGLQAKGVVFEHYDGMELKGEVLNVVARRLRSVDEVIAETTRMDLARQQRMFR